jgi:subtilisin family serine protease
LLAGALAVLSTLLVAGAVVVGDRPTPQGDASLAADRSAAGQRTPTPSPSGLAAASPVAPGPAQPAADAPRFVPGELLVRVAPGDRAASAETLEDEAGTEVEQRLPLPGLKLVSLPPGDSVPETARELEALPGVRYAEPNFIYGRSSLPNDPELSRMWGLENSGQRVRGTRGTVDADIDAPAAWDVTTGDPAVRVGVADDGVAPHPDLVGNLLPGRDFVDLDADATPAGRTDFHGTHVAGTIGAVGDNGIGGAGVSQDVGIVPLRIFDEAGQTTAARIVSAFSYAGAQGLDVVNASFGGMLASRAERDAVRGASGTLLVVAAGNYRNNHDRSPDFPCAFGSPNIVCVAATDQRDRLARFSNFGRETVDLAAPGVDVLSTVPRDSLLNDFGDGFDDPLGTRWTLGGRGLEWGRERRFHDASLTDSPDEPYRNRSDSWARSAAIDLTARKRCSLIYWGDVRTERGSDYLVAEVSGDRRDWVRLERHSGHRSISGIERLPEELQGDESVYVRFRLDSDRSGRDEGIWLNTVFLECLATEDTYGYLDGTSMAAPHVSGAAALILAAHPSADVAEIRRRLLDTVDPLPSLDGRVATGGRLNVARAVQAP